MLEVGTVVRPRCQHGYGRIAAAPRRQTLEGFQQRRRVVGDGAHTLPHHQFGKRLRHHSSVGEHVRDPARASKVVFQNAVLPIGVADEVAADHVRIRAVRQRDPQHLTAETGVFLHQKLRDASIVKDLLVVVDVVQE